MDIAHTLKSLRAKNKLSQAQIAKIVDTKVSAVSRWEQGSVKPNLEMAVKLATALNVSMDVFCGISDTPPSKLEKLALKASDLPQIKINALEIVLSNFIEEL
jgi:transcriptional regulator with XRE-family HTH domain